MLKTLHTTSLALLNIYLQKVADLKVRDFLLQTSLKPLELFPFSEPCERETISDVVEFLKIFPLF